MSIADYIRDDIFKPRLKAECLVVYDQDQRYRDICLDLAEEQVAVIDTSVSGIESREQAQAAFLKVASGSLKGMVIYVPTAAPATDGQRQKDPFSVYVQCGTQFPESDGDEYFNLCLKAKPEHNTEIRRIFQNNPSPPFAAIDAVGGGISWPQLRTTLQADSAVDILIAFLLPTAAQQQAIKTETGWLPEAKDFFKATLGLTLKTRAKSWSPIADELWRFVLFSEFVFDLPIPLPEALQAVPYGPPEVEVLVCDLCDRLRNDQRYQEAYLERAEAIEAELNLPPLCADIEDLGQLNTFPFEERTFLQRAVQGILNGDLDVTRNLLTRHSQSIWRSKGENQEQWSLLQTALNLIVTCGDVDRQLPEFGRSQESLINAYVESLRQIDQRQRELEESVGNAVALSDSLDAVLETARGCYRRLTEKIQMIFTRQIEHSGWPPQNRLANTEVFKRFLTPRLSEKGQRLAYLMIDALRYELGIELEKLLSEIGIVEMHTACAQLPTVTPIGMASLLPEAHNSLTLDIDQGKLVPKIGDTVLGNVTQRMGYLKKLLGDRFAEMTLRDFISKKNPRVEPTVDLLVLRSTEIDSQLESNPEDTLSLIPKTLKQIRVALTKLAKLGFQEAIIVSDHGFFLNAQAEAGDVCTKPQGNWLYTAHDRMLLGNGTADAHNLVLSVDKLGIRSNADQVALPKTMAPYRAGHLYFHGGASLAEAIVPVLVVRLDSEPSEKLEQFQVELSYKRGSKRITTRLPRIELSLLAGNLFSQTSTCELLLEAQDAQGEVVGEPRPSEDVNPATRTITLFPGETKQIVLRMDAMFEGKFTIKALDPNTLRTYASLNLETDYTV